MALSHQFSFQTIAVSLRFFLFSVNRFVSHISSEKWCLAVFLFFLLGERVRFNNRYPASPEMKEPRKMPILA